MADERVVKVTLKAQYQGYVADMNKAAQATAGLGKEGQKLAESKAAFDRLGRSAVAAGGLIAVGIGVAVSRFAEFDQAMSNVAATGDDAKRHLEELSKAALEAGSSTVFSATEAAGAIENLAKAGLDTADILGGALTGSLDLAAAGGLAVADAAETAATTLQQFGLEGSDAVHVADLLAAGAGKAMGDVSDMAAALKQSGLVANQFGISVEETVGSLSAFASAGLLGSDAGTSFKTMLLQLAKPSKQAADLMGRLGINVYDARGQFIGLQGLAGQLEQGLAGLTDQQKQAALATIFGTDAIRAATVLYNEGADGISEWTEKVDDAGYAAETAATRLDNLKGDVEALQGALDTAFISMGEAADGPLRLFTQSLTDMVDGFNKLPDGAKQAVTWVGAIAAGVAVSGGAYLLAIPKIAAYNAALASMGAAAQKTSRILGSVGKGAGLLVGLGLAVSVLDKIATGADKAAPGIDRVVKLLNSGNIDGAFKNASASADSFAKSLELVAGSSFDSNMERIGETLGGVAGITGVVTEARDGFAALDGALAQMVSSGNGDEAAAQFAEFTEKAEAQGVSVEKLKELFPQYDNALAGVTDSTKTAADATSAAAGAYLDAAEEAKGLNDQLKDLIDTVMQSNGVGQDAISANLDYKDALADVKKEIKEGEKAWGDSTQAGRDHKQMLVDLADESQYAANVQFELDGNTEDYLKRLEKGRQTVIDNAKALGATAEEAENLADQIYEIPSEKEIKLIADTVAASKKINTFVREYNGQTILMHLDVDGAARHASGVGGDRERAAGGAITGPGTGTSDTAGLYALSNGEHVLTAADVRAMGGQDAVYDFRRDIHSGGSGNGSGPTVVYVQSPWTGEYLLAKAVKVAEGVVAAQDLEDAVRF